MVGSIFLVNCGESLRLSMFFFLKCRHFKHTFRSNIDTRINSPPPRATTVSIALLQYSKLPVEQILHEIGIPRIYNTAQNN